MRTDADPTGIDVWLAFYERFDKASLDSMRALLSEDERDRESKYYFEDSRRCHVVARAMVRTVLSRHAPVAPEAWRFVNNGYGRPKIAAEHADLAPSLDFNISHTRGLIAMVIARGLAIGVDVENTGLRPAPLDIADRFFAASEVAGLAQVSQAQRQERFYEYWTFKESYIKARGMGLSLPLDRFGFHFPDPQSVRVAIDPVLGDTETQWSFWQCRPTPLHMLALCAGRTSAVSALRFHSFGGLDRAGRLALTITRTSER